MLSIANTEKTPKTIYRHDRGISLLEVLVAMALLMISVGGFLTAIKDSMRIESVLRERERNTSKEVGEDIEKLQLYFSEQGAKSY